MCILAVPSYFSWSANFHIQFFKFFFWRSLPFLVSFTFLLDRIPFLRVKFLHWITLYLLVPLYDWVLQAYFFFINSYHCSWFKLGPEEYCLLFSYEESSKHEYTLRWILWSLEQYQWGVFAMLSLCELRIEEYFADRNDLLQPSLRSWVVSHLSSSNDGPKYLPFFTFALDVRILSCSTSWVRRILIRCLYCLGVRHSTIEINQIMINKWTNQGKTIERFRVVFGSERWMRVAGVLTGKDG